MNETLKVMEARRSCRNFDKKKMVSAEDIEAIVKAALMLQQEEESRVRLLLQLRIRN